MLALFALIGGAVAHAQPAAQSAVTQWNDNNGIRVGPGRLHPYLDIEPMWDSAAIYVPTQVKGLLRISEQSDVALQEAVSKRDSTAAEHEYSKISIARNKVAQLRTESEQCIGQLAFRTDENLTVEVEVPSGLPEDPTNPPPLAPPTSRLPPASPIL